jgi:hypothetical protein
VEEDFLLLEVAEDGATGSRPSESSYSNYGISCVVEWSGVEGSGSSERGLRVCNGTSKQVDREYVMCITDRNILGFDSGGVEAYCRQ